jgi:hypothetical protein
MEWGWLLCKALAGTCLFTVILWCAQSGNPRTAGMLLTFPAFNGIGLLAAESQNLSLMVSAMLPLIATNGVLCAAYILGYRRLCRAARRVTARTTATCLLVVCLALWGLMALFLTPRLHAWLTSPGHIALGVLLYTLGAWPLTVRWLWAPGQEQRRVRQSWRGVLRANQGKIGGIFLLLTLVMLCARFGADAWAGRLSTLPVLPFYSLLAVATETPTAPGHGGRLEQLGSTVLAGPLVAIAFVWAFSAYLQALGLPCRSPGCMLGGVAGLLVGWGVCGLLTRTLVWAAGHRN